MHVERIENRAKFTIESENFGREQKRENEHEMHTRKLKENEMQSANEKNQANRIESQIKMEKSVVWVFGVL